MASVFFHWLHTVAAMLWIGGVAFIIFSLLPTLRGTVDMQARQRIMGAMVPRFRMIVGGCLGILLVTGVVNMAGKVEFATLFSTPYGITLSAKLLPVMVMFALYLTAPTINRRFQNRECGHAAVSGACEHDSPAAPARKWPEIGIVLHAIVLILGAIVIFLGKMLTAQ